MTSAGLDLVCDNNIAKMGVMTHEYLHTFGLIDLYDYSFEGKGLGNFDIMAYPYGHGNDGYIPVHLSVWAKWSIDWIDCPNITTTGEYVVGPSATSSDCYRINHADWYEDTGGEPGLDEYILIENRQKMTFDIGFWTPGLVFYHVDDLAFEQYDRGYPGQDGWPQNGNHYQIAVLQADKEYHLENGVNIGEAGDIWVAGTKLTPNIDGQTYPNTDSYQAGIIRSTGLTIEVMDQRGQNAVFVVSQDTRSSTGSNSGLFSTPEKENQYDDSTKNTLHYAHEQFETSNGDKISGKLPQLAWYNEWEQQEKFGQQQEAALLAEQAQVSGSSLSGQHHLPHPIVHEEVGNEEIVDGSISSLASRTVGGFSFLFFVTSVVISSTTMFL